MDGSSQLRTAGLLQLDPMFRQVPIDEQVLPVVEGVLGKDFLLTTFSAIDVQHRESVIAVIGSSLSGRAAVIVTHDREVVASLADRVAVMIGGTIRQLGPVDEVFTLPADDEVAMAVGLGNVLSRFRNRDSVDVVEVSGLKW